MQKSQTLVRRKSGGKQRLSKPDLLFCFALVVVFPADRIEMRRARSPTRFSKSVRETAVAATLPRMLPRPFLALLLAALSVCRPMAARDHLALLGTYTGESRGIYAVRLNAETGALSKQIGRASC